MSPTDTDPLAPLVALPGVVEACESAREALAGVHRHRANLRGWPTTSAESVLRGARASAGVEGADVRIDDEVTDPVTAAALRLAGELTGPALDRSSAVWTRSPLQQLARLHLIAGAVPGADPATLGRPRDVPGLAGRLQDLAAMVTGGTSAPAPVLAAVVHGELASLRPFGTADGLVARAASRLVTVSSGLDPHCLGVPEVTWYRDAAGYRSALDGFASGTADGVRDWVLLCCRALADGAREARSIADAAG